MKRVQYFSLFFMFLLLLSSGLFAEEKQLPAIHLSSSEENKPEEQTVPASKIPDEQPVETVAFNGIIPARTTVAELHKMFGKPLAVKKDTPEKGITTEEYKIDGFKGVDFHIMNGIVYGVIAEFPESVNARKLAADLGMEYIQSVFLTTEKGVIQGEIFPEIGVAYGYDPSQKLGTIEEMQKDPESIPMNVIQLIFQPVGPEPFLLRAETWVDINPKSAYKDILQALKLDPKNEQALAYKKILEEARPELKNEEKPKAQEAEEPKPQAEEPKPQAEEPKPEAEEPKPEAEEPKPEAEEPKPEAEEPKPEAEEPKPEAEEPKPEAEEPKPEVDSKTEASLTDLTPPDLESLSSETEKPEISSDEKASGTQEEELPATLDLEEKKEEPKEEEKEKISEKIEEESISLQLETPEEITLSPEPEKEEETVQTLDLPQELSDDLATMDDPVEAKPEPEAEEPPVLTFEDESFEKIETLARDGKIQEAEELLKKIRKDFIENPFVSFRANLVEGDILMIHSTPNADEALRCHRMASEQGEKLLEGKIYHGKKYALTEDEKRRVKSLLLDVWLGAASDLVLNSMDEKGDYVKWLEKASKSLDEIAPPDSETLSAEDINLRYRITFRTLSILLKLGENAETSEAVKRHLEVMMKKLSGAKNQTEYFEICAKTSLLLDDASTVEILKKNYKVATEYLNRGIKFMEQVKSHRNDFRIHEEFLLAQLYYHRGQVIALEAIHFSPEEKTKAHEQAVKWYDKSLPILLEVIKTKQWKDLLQLGKIVNGMSVSYAQLGNTKKASILLKTGVFCLEQHVVNHPRDAIQLQIPYKNLIRILNYLGQKEEAEMYQKKLEGLLKS